MYVSLFISPFPKHTHTHTQPVEHESMESLKTMDQEPIHLYECFKAFVREDDLGEEECWYIHVHVTCM